jgi:hypothetical protein
MAVTIGLPLMCSMQVCVWLVKKEFADSWREPKGANLLKFSQNFSSLMEALFGGRKKRKKSL